MITMAGLGSRFSTQGYTCPKYQITAHGRTLFDWSMLSMQAFFDQRFVFAFLEEHDGEWLKRAAHGVGIKDVVLAPRAALSSGQAETAVDALAGVDPEAPLWIYNIDTYVASGLDPEAMAGAAGCLHVFSSCDPGMSFVRYGEKDAVVEIAEKRVISEWATVGIYGFRSAALYQTLYERAYERQEVATVKGERYIAPMYDLLVADGERVVAPKLQLADVHILGTPAQVLAFDPEAHAPLGNVLKNP